MGRGILKYFGLAVSIIIATIAIIAIGGSVHVHYQKSMILRQNYAELKRHYADNNTQEFIKALTFFQSRNKLDYKDVIQLKQNVESNLNQKISTLTEKDTRKKINIYIQLSQLDPSNKAYSSMERYFQAELARQNAEKARMLQRKEEIERSKITNDLKRYWDLLEQLKVIPTLVRKIEGESVGGQVIITVTNPWHYKPYQVRLQMAQGLWEKWAGIHSPSNRDRSRIKIVDLRGNDVGGSGWLGGSLIKVKE